VYADAPAGVRAADLCAAPGGKTLALTRTASYVLAADRSPARLRLLRRNLLRTGRRAGVVAARAEAPPFRSIDFVLLDVPCTGTGTLRRHPDARWRLIPEDIAKLAAVQAGMLDAAAPVVPPGGLLVYSTCTLEPEENEDQVARFLARHRGFRLEPGGALDPGLLDRGFLRVLPQRTGFDGAFAARMRRAV
jgi:16S rRNA (cytosine967-C5)-methyltransferase